MKRLLAVVLNLILVCSMLVIMTPAAEAAEGGPDEWGYKWTDSNSPDPSVAFNWIELDGIGTDSGLVGDDECTAPIAIGFPFEFYGNQYDMVNLTTNGLAIFDFDSTEDYNYQIPIYWASPQNFVAAFWDDLTVNDGSYNSGSVIYSTIGSAPNRQFVAEWHEVSRDYYYEQLTFEIILNETGEIWVQYLELSGETGESATVGLENYDGLLGIEYSYDSSILTNGLAVRFDEYPIGISNYQYDRAFPGDSTLFEVRIRNAQEFTDSFDVSASSENGWTVSLFDDTMAPLVDNNLNGDPDTGDIPAGDILTFWVQVDVPPSPAEAFDVTSVVVASFADPAVDATSILTTEVNSAEFIEASTLDWGIDSESDGTYDLLTLYAEFDAYFDTRCYVEADLYTAAGNYVGYDAGYVYPVVGVNGVPFYFEGEDIWARGDSGQFIAYFYLYDYDWEWIDTMTYTSSYYDYTDFNSPRAYFVTPFSESAADLDGDTLYDVLLVDVTVQVDVEGSYHILAYIDAGTGYIEQSLTSTMELAVGSHVVTLDFSGFTIYYSGESGPYTVYADLYDDIAGEWLDSANGTTAAYSYTEFTDVWGAFSPPYSDYGVDDDSDGLYESLVIEIYIDVVSPGEYYLYLDLYDATDTFWLLNVDTYSYLTYGANTVQVEIDAYRLVAAGYDGPYIAYVGLYTSWSWIFLDWDMHTTSAYTLDEFDPTPAVFQPPHDDYGYDADSDGAYDYLYVDVYFYAYETGDYSVTGDLLDASSVTIGTYYYSGYFWDGWNDVYLEYSGGAIYNNGEDGPYTVELSLYDEWDNLLDTDTYVTAAYTAGDFDAPQALFSPPHSDSGYDEDSDGLYEWLSVNVTIEVFVDGWCEVDAYLYDQYSTYLDGAYYYNYLDIGTQTVELLFQSYDINSNAVDGPYTVELYLYDAWWYLQDSDLYTTDAYPYADFEGYGASFDTPFVGHAVDEDSDGLYDSLAVDVPVNVTTPGDYEIEMYLYTDSWDYLVSAYAADTYDVGVTVTTLYFAGEDVFLSSHDGMFIADAGLYNSEWDWVDSHAEDIGPYYYSDFVPPAAYFSPTHSDYALDEDMDGLVDYIVVNASVNVTVAGTYLVRGWLYDQWGSYVCYAEAQVDLDVGDEQAVPILFDGWFAWANGEDGIFDVYMVLSSVETGWLEDTWYTTQDYYMADFDPTPPSLVSTYTNSPPTVDGIYSAGEWDFATVVELTEADPENGLDAVMRVANNETLLFVCFDVYGDPYEDDDDSSAISFDTGNDGVATDGAEDQFTIGPAILNEQTHAVYDDGSTDWTVDCTPFQPTWPDHEGLAGAYGFGTSDEYFWYDHRIYEYAIPLGIARHSCRGRDRFRGRQHRVARRE